MPVPSTPTGITVTLVNAPKRLQANDLVYQGAVRLPLASTDAQSANYGGSALSWWAANSSLLMAGFPQTFPVAELVLPTPVIASTIGALPRAVKRQGWVDILSGHIHDIDPSSMIVGGLLPTATGIIVAAYVYYDGSGLTSLSHFKTVGTNFSALPAPGGPWQMGTVLHQAGFYAGYMTPIPSAWQAQLGGTHLCGLWGLAVVSRTSLGPSAHVFNAVDVGTLNPIPATRVLGYPANHPTLGAWDSSGHLYNGTVTAGGGVFPANTSSLLFFQRRGTGTFRYGVGTTNQALDGQPVPNEPGVIYCYDPAIGGKGPHAYPYVAEVLAYDVADLIAVKQGQRNPWDLQPYARWDLTLPFMNLARTVGGVTYDPATNRILVCMVESDGTAPLIHTYQVAA